jgi:hypothetical protein
LGDARVGEREHFEVEEPQEARRVDKIEGLEGEVELGEAGQGTAGEKERENIFRTSQQSNH